MKHWATFLMVFFGWEFCVEIQRRQMVSGRSLDENFRKKFLKI